MRLLSVVLSMLLLCVTTLLHAADLRVTMDLNGMWEFEQTPDAMPPARFTRTIPVPGLIHLAQPPIAQHDVLFSVETRIHSLRRTINAGYTPQYNWYRRTIFVPAELEGTNAVLTVLKSRYTTDVLVNGIAVGHTVSTATPLDCDATRALRFGADNEILIRVGDWAWHDKKQPGSVDSEQTLRIPGIWDNVSLSFTGSQRIHRALLLPSLADKQLTVKLLVDSYRGSRVRILVRDNNPDGAARFYDDRTVEVESGNLNQVEFTVPVKDPRPWSPEDPYLYTAEITLMVRDSVSDRIDVRFGMRDFKPEPQGKHFALNGKKRLLRGSNVTLHRFFEDPECANLPWNREWVTRLLTELPPRLAWNALRVCVGIVPQFWYDIADEHGLLLQNEWFFWSNGGWDSQIREEYTDWVWTDGSHPSIVIWDAVNENNHPYKFIGMQLIPELMKLDPTRIWDAGWMPPRDMAIYSMDEAHMYPMGPFSEDYRKRNMEKPFRLGDLDYADGSFLNRLNFAVPVLWNEYNSFWTWRNGLPGKLSRKNFAFYLSDDPPADEQMNVNYPLPLLPENAMLQENVTPAARRELQAYALQLQTEWLRAERSFAGVLSFNYLSNDYGFTGDWFIGHIRDLQPGPSLDWSAHCFAPAAVFINLVDGRYVKTIKPYEPKSTLAFNLTGVNDLAEPVNGTVLVKLLNAKGVVVNRQTTSITIPPYRKAYRPVSIHLPSAAGGYLILAEFTPAGAETKTPFISRRYIKVGKAKQYAWFEYQPKPLMQD